ncbi:MAG TPA: hypothetical protein VIL36_21315 [Acidimicrobiales bacterium]
MSRSFRYEAPEPRADLLPRPRLLRTLNQRWQHRVVCLRGGPGLGKTTLLAQAIAENRLAPRGDDIWLTIEASDADAGHLAHAVTTALARCPHRGPTAPPRPQPRRPAAAYLHALLGAGRARPGARSADEGDSTARASDVEPNGSAEPGPGADRPHRRERRPAPPHDRDGIATPREVAAALLQRAETDACLVLDDLHLLPAGSPGADWLAELVDVLPTNGHLVFASRTTPPVPLNRHRARGEVVEIREDQLRFSPDELTGFALRRGIQLGALRHTGGWPAMAELIASAGPDFTGSYLWEQVLDPLGADRRQILAVVCELGRADAELAEAALGGPVDLDAAIGGVPLVDRRANGWYVPHDLWRTAPQLDLADAERASVRRRAAAHLVERGSFDDAFTLLQTGGLWDAVPDVLRAACLSSDRLPAGLLSRWMAACPAEVRASPPGILAAAFRTVMTAPTQATPALEHAVEACREAGDDDAEVAAIAQLAMVSWLRQDKTVRDSLTARIAALAAEGHPGARELVTLRSAFVADVAGDEDGVLEHLERLDARALPPLSRVLAGAVEAAIHYTKGDPETAGAIVERVLPDVDPSLRWFVEGIGLMSRQALGELDDVVAELPRVMDDARATGSAPMVHPGMSIATVMYAYAGRTATARAMLNELRTLLPSRVGTPLPVLTMLATIAVLVAEGDEETARITLVHTINSRWGIDRSMLRRWWRHSLALTYVLAPEARAHWDAAELTGAHAVARDLAALVVEQRTTGCSEHLRTAQLPPLPVVRSLLHFRHAAELAAGLTAVGRHEGVALLDLLGPPGRDALRALAEAPTPSKPARALLAAAPAPPPIATRLLLLGHLEVRRLGAGGGDAAGDEPGGEAGAEEVVDPDLRRQRVRELLAFLVDERTTTRSRVMAALWPDRDERAAGNNLAVTLNWLLRLLEPWRGPGEPPYLVRLDGPTMRLVTGDHLRIDVDDFEAHHAAAVAADREEPGSGAALAHHLAAVDLYRGDLCADLDAEWLELPRAHYRSRFLDSAVRAAQLLLADGDTDRAEAVAHRALAADAWREDAYAVLVRVALQRQDRSAAHRLLGLCLDALADLGVDPSTTTLQLQRQLTTA